MLKNLLIKISFVGIGNIINAFLGLIFLAVVARTLTVELFGKYALLTSLLVSLSKIIDFGTNSLFVSKSISLDQDLKESFVSSKTILFLITLPISFLILWIFKLTNPWILLLFFVGLTAYGLNITFFAFFQKTEMFTHAILLNTLPAFTKGLIATLIFFKIITPDFNQLFAIFSLSMLTCIILYIFLPKDLRPHFKSDIKLNKAFSLLKHSLSPGLSLLITNGWSALSNSIAKITKTFTDVGIFSIADKVANVFSLVSLSIFTVLLPKNALRKRNKLSYEFKETFVLSVIIMIMAVLAVIVFKFFILFFIGDKYKDSILLLDTLIFSSAFTAIHVFMENYFFVEEQTHTLLAINGGKLAIFLISCFVLIPLLSLKGLAISQLIASISALLFTIVMMYNSRKRTTV